ncbi:MULTISPECIES: cysteine hydrolase family protein [Brevibacillus]|jgi:nicotinamidase-related amidase|uniref:cysteine hydrolase family protein n=1 Tax=Brevibacillus TaxID=55080 RepID=UPI000F08F2BE|nr:cysteine hydrolase family protein [Brevibacillus borstelensis]MBE5397333.1 cysteine hydrolase [Brevibacillus borstelensis]MCM3561605.1 cysteine hydrolase [Brevibacillus borstelensis]MCM3625423.1 cysteine hydrolase [Brevibacillus borstelensis]MED1745040.1 cysteine hydrolase family protein [Brevibacillus borstelensis]MED1854682.1 cysteine hydrolase family protein [Brevibacillus borstelensis]
MQRKTALLVIDVQVGIVEGPEIGPVFQKEDVLQTITKLISTARSQSIPVVYVQDLDVAAQDSAEFQIHPEIAPLSGELVIRKKATDAFQLTELHKELQARKINHLAVVGCKTEYCVDTTCRRATTLGYDVTLVADAHSTTGNDVLSAERIIAHHNALLHGLDNVSGFVMVRHSGENVFEPTHDQYR